MTENDAFILKKTKEFLKQIIKDKPQVRDELQALGWLFSCYENRESPEMEKEEEKRRLIKCKSGILWCPCGNLIGDTSLCYETEGGVGVSNITRSYYLCNICESEFDLEKTKVGWDYTDFEERFDMVDT